MKKIIYLFILAVTLLSGSGLYAQQLPVFTQFPSDELFFNPAYAGTKRIYDIRLNYRDQWTGFPDAPITEGLSLNYRLNNHMGLGAYIYQDETGPTQRNDYTVCYSYKLKFPDVILSLGAAGSMMDYFVNGSKVTLFEQYDPAVDQAITTGAWVPNASAGALLYNDRFQFGLSVDDLISSNANLYKHYVPDTSKSGIVQMEPHFYGYLSYNFSGNPDYVWQSTLFACATSGPPIFLAYSLRVHVKQKFYIGASYVAGNSVSLDLGITIHDDFEVCYSYDYITSPLHSYTAGTQEITLIFSTDSFKKGGKKGDSFDEFQRKKYGYMF